MDQEQIIERILQKTNTYLRDKGILEEDGSVNEETALESLGMDSLDQVEFVMEIEEEFDIKIPDDDAEKLQTVKEVVKYITGAIKQPT